MTQKEKAKEKIRNPETGTPHYRGREGGFKEARSDAHGKRQKERTHQYKRGMKRNQRRSGNAYSK